MKIEYPDIGICGLSCKLCPSYNRDSKSRCPGCKTDFRMGAGCKFITCAIKKKGVEFCWECDESDSCEKWSKHVELGESVDSFKCYQTLKKDIGFIRSKGIKSFAEEQEKRIRILQSLMSEFDDSRSKSYFCIASTVMEIEDLNESMIEAGAESKGLDRKEKNKLLRSKLDAIADKKGLLLYLRK